MKLLVQGDDFGFTKGVIYGIVDAIDNGILRNTGLFANSPYARLAASFMDERRDKVCFGIDFNLVSGPSLLKKEDIPHLIDDQGIFIRSGVRQKDDLYKTEEGRRKLFPYEEVYKELRAQYDAFVSLTCHKPGYLAPHSLGAETYLEAIEQIKNVERQSDKKVSEWQSNVALLTVNAHINYIKSKYKRNKKINQFLNDVKQDVLKNVQRNILHLWKIRRFFCILYIIKLKGRKEKEWHC